MQTVLVTGANGFVGYYIVAELLNQNYRVIASGSSAHHVHHSHPNFYYQPLDFTDAEAVAAVLQKWRPNIIVHSGALSKPDDCEVNQPLAFRTNVTGTVNLLNEAALFNAHFIFLSTDFVFDGERGMYKEDDERAPVNYYGQTKLLAEDETMNYPGNWSIVRTILVYGKSGGEKKSFLENVVEAARLDKSLRIFNDQLRMPTYAGDLAKGIATICTKKAAGIFHLSGKNEMTVYDAACQAIGFNGLNKNLVSPIQDGDLIAPAKRPKKTGFDVSKARGELGYNPVDFHDGLRKTFHL